MIRASDGRIGHREIARAFGIKGGGAKIAIKAMLKKMAAEGKLVKSRGRKFVSRGVLPPTDVIEITKTDNDGDLFAKPVKWTFDVAPPSILVVQKIGKGLALGVGDRVLAKLVPSGDDAYEARPIKKIARSPSKLVGIIDTATGVAMLRPADRRFRLDVVIPHAELGGAGNGELVAVEITSTPSHGPQRGRVVERLGKIGKTANLSLIAVHAHGIPHEFSSDSERDAKAAVAAPMGEREDLRKIPLVTIDGEDARDFDDAVFAEPDTDPANPGGWHLIVAIADVSWYVRAGKPLDRDAYDRGNSVYFPDRVVPMLPEQLSNGWCSLKPREDRGVLAAHMWISAEGKLLRHKIVRGMMNSLARLTYTQVQNARDGHPDDTTGPLMQGVIKPLYGAYKALNTAREKRGTLDLDLVERQILVDRDSGKITGVIKRARFDSHKLIEEFMITANVAAAETLEKSAYPCVYRVHEPPDPDRVDALREALATLSLRLPHDAAVRPGDFNTVLDKVRKSPHEHLVNTLVLRTQSQAVYSTNNLGHFGLALKRYAHFTSPIRRYSDLLVHRALIAALKLGEGGWDSRADPDMEAVTTHISMTERRAATAERETVDRFTAAYLADRIDAEFTGRINGATRFGAFITLDESGADGILPHRHLPQDFYDLDETNHRLIGRRHGLTLRVGDRVTVRLLETDEVTGSIVFAYVAGGESGGRGERSHRPSRPHRTDARKGGRKKHRR